MEWRRRLVPALRPEATCEWRRQYRPVGAQCDGRCHGGVGRGPQRRKLVSLLGTSGGVAGRGFHQMHRSFLGNKSDWGVLGRRNEERHRCEGFDRQGNGEGLCGGSVHGVCARAEEGQELRQAWLSV